MHLKSFKCLLFKSFVAISDILGILSERSDSGWPLRASAHICCQVADITIFMFPASWSLRNLDTQPATSQLTTSPLVCVVYFVDFKGYDVAPQRVAGSELLAL